MIKKLRFMQSTGNKMGFNHAPGALGAMAVNERILGSEKLPGAMNSANGSDPASSPFPTMPFFLPSLNGAALPGNLANNVTQMTPAGEHPSSAESPAGKHQRDGSTSGRSNSKLYSSNVLWRLALPSDFSLKVKSSAQR